MTPAERQRRAAQQLDPVGLGVLAHDFEARQDRKPLPLPRVGLDAQRVGRALVVAGGLVMALATDSSATTRSILA